MYRTINEHKLATSNLEVVDWSFGLHTVCCSCSDLPYGALLMHPQRNVVYYYGAPGPGGVSVWSLICSGEEMHHDREPRSRTTIANHDRAP
jgi:hypothetical protein